MKLILPTLLLSLLLATAARAAEIKVAAAASLKDVVTLLAKDYKTASGDDVTFTFGSSGQLATQIKNGAETDAFISAANKQVDDLTTAGLTDASTRCVIAGNTLVLIVPAAAKDAPASFADLADPKFKKIAIGDPKTVPAGDYATQTLTSLKLLDKLTDRLVYGVNVRQVLAYVEDADVAAGLVYSTDAKQSGDKVKVIATADESTHQPIVYPAIVIKAGKNRDATLQFLAFLQSPSAQKVLTDQGFSLPTPPAPPK